MSQHEPASLRLKALHAVVDGHEVLRNIDLQILPGELFVLLGGAGAGKSALLRAIAGLDPLAGGEVWLDDKDITGIPAQRRHTAMLLQAYPLWPHLKVIDNVAFGLRRHGLSRAAASSRAAHELAQLGLGDFALHLPSQLTDSQRQRVALARTLATDDRLLLLDEPFSAVDRLLRERLMQMLRARQQHNGITTVVTTQERHEALRFADRIAVLHHGELQQVGTPAELYEQPRNRHVAEYLGGVNLLDGEVEYAGDQPLFRTDNGLVIPLFDQAVKRARNGSAMFRPHDLRIVSSDEEPFGDQIRFTARVEQVEFLGDALRYAIDLAGKTVWMDLPRRPGRIQPEIGDQLFIGLDPACIRILER